MFCEQCGAPIPEGARFCGQCGAPVAVEQPSASAPAPTPASAPKPEPAPEPAHWPEPRPVPPPETQSPRQGERVPRAGLSPMRLVIGTVVLLADLLLMFLILRTPSGAGGKGAGENPIVPDLELTIAEQEGETPLPPVVGNSKPVDVQPVDGIRITAPENALDKDREFKITAVDEKTWDESEKRIAEASGQQMLFCFDLDADMEADERMPGYFTVALDLEEMGVPSIMHPYLSVWRLEGDQQDEYTSWVENGKLIFNSDQNCVISIAAVGWFFLDKVALLAVGITAGATLAWGYDKVTLPDKLPSLYKGYFSMEDDVSHIKLKHPSGDHTLYFRYSKTENGDRYEDFKTRKQDLKKRMAELEKMADEEYKRQLDAQYGKETFDWMKSWANARSRKAIDRAAILTALVEKDERIKEIKELFQLPRSIVDFGCQLIAANSFLTEQEDLNKPFWNVNVYLVGTEELGTDNGHLEYPFSAAPYLVLNYERMRGGANEYSRKGPGENMLLTVTHELYHYRQKKSQWITNMDFRTEETTAAYQEKTAYQYYLAKGEIVSRATDKSASFIEFSSRDNYEVFGRDFNHKIKKGEKGAEESYTYADVMDYLQKKKGLEKPLKGKHIIQCYSDWTSHKSLYMDWFGIKDEKEFAGYIQGFCEENLEKIHSRQGMASIDKSLQLQTYSVSPSHPVVDAKTETGELIMRTFDIQGDPKDGRYHALLVPGKACTAEEITFYSSIDKFVKDRKRGGLSFDADDFLYAGAYFKPHSSVLPFKIVALYAPEKPEINRVKKNELSFRLPKPEKALLKNKCVTGAILTYKNAKGQEQILKTTDSQFGKLVKWSLGGANQTDFSLTVRWYYETQNGSLCESPESEPALYQAQQTEEEEPAEEPGTGYWELVDTKTEGQLSYTDEHGCTATISGGDGKYTYHADYLARFFEKGVIPTMTTELIYVTPYTVKHWRTIDHDFIFETPKQFYLPGEEPGPGMITEAVRVTTVQHDGNVDQFDSQTNFSALCYCSIKGLNENIQPYDGFVFNRPSLKEQKQRHESNTPIPTHDLFFNKTKDGFRMIQEINTPHAEKCYLRIIYTYMWREGKIKKK